MNPLKTGLIGLAVVALLLLLCPAVEAQPGDCDGDNSIGVSDAIYIISYLFGGGSPPSPANYADCDCDGFPGVNYADAVHIMQMVFAGATGYPSPGTDLIAPAGTGIMISGRVDGTTHTNMYVFINNPTVLDGGLTLPFSFAPGPGEATLNCASITINPVFAGAVTSSIDNTNKIFQLWGALENPIPATTNWEILCQAQFALGGPPGNPVKVDPTTTGRLFPLLVARAAYNGTDFERMLFPRFIPDAFEGAGDANCDGSANVSDAVYLIRYIFLSGPPPGDPDGDGIPNCPAP